MIEYVPVLQFLQLLLPDISLNVPAGHAIHTFSEEDCPGKNPALHVQFVKAMLPVIADVPFVSDKVHAGTWSWHLLRTICMRS